MTNPDNLVVEVIAAHNLMPKDGQGSSSPYVEVEFENQKRRTRSVQKDLNPVWNEPLVFPISDPAGLPYRSIHVSVFHDRSTLSSRTFLGRIRIPASSVPSHSDAATHLFPLEKRSLFSHIRGDLTLRPYLATGPVTVEPDASEKNQQVLYSTSTTGVTGDGAKQNQQKMVPTKKKQQHKQPKNQAQQKQLEKPKPVPAVPKPPVVLTTGGPPLPGIQPVFPTMATEHDFSLKETRPHLGADKSASAYDLVEQMDYLYVRVVRARGVPVSAPRAEVKLGNYRGITRDSPSSDWDQVFAFSKDCVQSSIVEVFVKSNSEVLGRVALDLAEVPTRAPPDSSLAPQWYRAESSANSLEIMLSAWFGTQVDEAFAEAWHSKAAGVPGDAIASIKSKIYLSPKLWYLRITIIEAQDLIPAEKSAVGRLPELSAKAQLGSHVLRTRVAHSPFWHEELLFVAAEPFDENVTIWIEEAQEVLGRAEIPVSAVERRTEVGVSPTRWLALERAGGLAKVNGRVQVKMCLEGGYHVLDECTSFGSDLRAADRSLWGPPVGSLEMGILGARGLPPTKVREGPGATVDAYCVAKYGTKWVRTRTVIGSTSPQWNEQYTWDVFDPCTVVTVAVFDNCHVDRGGPGRDARIGKIRIRISTLELDRVYTHGYPIVMLGPMGVKKMGELHLAVRFSSSNFAGLMQLYALPMLPAMHYAEPISVRVVENLRFQAVGVVAARLGRAEPPLGGEVVEYMLDYGSGTWSMRRSKANFFRLIAVLSGPVGIVRWLNSVRNWEQPVRSTVVAVLFLVFLSWPELMLPVGLVVLAGVGMWRYRLRVRNPPHMDARLSQADAVFGDELDEEFDTFPTSRPADVVRMRYDRLRSVAGRVQTVVGDLATQGERFHALLGWRDPRATLLFLVFCLAMAVLLYLVPVRVVVGLWGAYEMRPPRFRSPLPSAAMSFFRRLPTKADSLL